MKHQQPSDGSAPRAESRPDWGICLLMHTLKGSKRLCTALALPRAQLLLPATPAEGYTQSGRKGSTLGDAKVYWAASELGSI